MHVGDGISKRDASWTFSGGVYKNFDKHINKSVPFYKECQDLFIELSDFFIADKSKVIDLGCSTGSFLKKLVLRNNNRLKKKIIYIGYDNVKEMINFAKKNSKLLKNIKFINKSVLSGSLKNTSIISAFYTIQFIHPSKRQYLINKIYKNLNWGGAFFMVEKVRAPDARFQDILNQSYNEFKIKNGFSTSEILSKSKSLKGVLEPFSSKANFDMLKRAGFKDIIIVFRYLCFEGLIAVK
jgi:tRNA (cmo5U34)-methyltransferase